MASRRSSESMLFFSDRVLNPDFSASFIWELSISDTERILGFLLLIPFILAITFVKLTSFNLVLIFFQITDLLRTKGIYFSWNSSYLSSWCTRKWMSLSLYYYSKKLKWNSSMKSYLYNWLQVNFFNVTGWMNTSLRLLLIVVDFSRVKTLFSLLSSLFRPISVGLLQNSSTTFSNIWTWSEMNSLINSFRFFR